MADINNASDTENNSEYKEHAKKYTDFLEEYKNYTKNSNILKDKYKRIFFWIIIVVLCMLVLLFFASVCIGFIGIVVIVILEKESVEVIAGIITTVASSFSAVIVALFKLPKIIAEYLFNKEEESSMVKIIEQIQQYDRNMYALEKDVERKLMENSEPEPDISSSESLDMVPENPNELNNSDVHNPVASEVTDSVEVTDENDSSVTA